MHTTVFSLLAQVQQVADATSEYLKAGVLGASVIVVGAVCVVLWRENKALRAQIDAVQAQRLVDVQALQQLRVEDAHQVSQQLLQNNTASTAVLQNVTNALKAQSDLTLEIKTVIEKLIDRLRPGLR